MPHDLFLVQFSKYIAIVLVQLIFGSYFDETLRKLVNADSRRNHLSQERAHQLLIQ